MVMTGIPFVSVYRDRYATRITCSVFLDTVTCDIPIESRDDSRLYCYVELPSGAYYAIPGNDGNASVGEQLPEENRVSV